MQNLCYFEIARNDVPQIFVLKFVGSTGSGDSRHHVTNGTIAHILLEDKPLSCYILGIKIRLLRSFMKAMETYFDENLLLHLQEMAKQSKNMQEVLSALFEDQEGILYKTFDIMLSAYEGGSLEELAPIYLETLYHMLSGWFYSIQVSNPESGENESDLSSPQVKLDLLSIRGGLSHLTEQLAERLSDSIHLNHSLKAISKNEDFSYSLTFTTGETAIADVVVLAIPCPVYRDINFAADVIDVNKLADICKVIYGRIAKMTALFINPPNRRGIYITENALSFSAFDPMIVNLYLLNEASQLENGNFDLVFNKYSPFINTGYANNCLHPCPLSKARCQSFSCYENAVIHSWTDDPFQQGSFSSIGVGQEQLLTSFESYQNERVKLLFHPIDDRLFFVGEHASILMDVPGTMEAACESGERTARMIECLFGQPL